jgi:hypothetical protein
MRNFECKIFLGSGATLLVLTNFFTIAFRNRKKLILESEEVAYYLPVSWTMEYVPKLEIILDIHEITPKLNDLAFFSSINFKKNINYLNNSGTIVKKFWREL